MFRKRLQIETLEDRRVCALVIGPDEGYLVSLTNANTEQRLSLSRATRRWQSNSDLASVRNADALAQLPETERTQWQALWKRVDEVRQKAETSKRPRAPVNPPPTFFLHGNFDLQVNTKRERLGGSEW